MAVATSSSKLLSELKVTHYLSGDATTPKDIAWVDMRDYDSILVTVLAAALTGAGVTVFKILANSASDGSGTDVEIKAHAVGSAPDAAGDYLVLEATAEEIGTAGAGLRYVTANIDAANAADQIAVTYIRRSNRPQAGLTADVVA